MLFKGLREERDRKRDFEIVLDSSKGDCYVGDT